MNIPNAIYSPLFQIIKYILWKKRTKIVEKILTCFVLFQYGWIQAYLYIVTTNTPKLQSKSNKLLKEIQSHRLTDRETIWQANSTLTLLCQFIADCDKNICTVIIRIIITIYKNYFLVTMQRWEQFHYENNGSLL